MIETKEEEERSPLEYFITGAVILFFGGLYYFINHTGDSVTRSPVQVVSTGTQSGSGANALLAGSAGLAVADKSKTGSPSTETKDADAIQKAATDEQSTEADASADAAKQKADEAKQQAVAALEAEKSKLEGEINLLKADREKLVETNTSLMQDADEVMKQVAATQQAARAQVSPQAARQADRAAGYQLPDGTPVPIEDEGFEGLLKQALEVRAINTPIIFDAIYFESGSSQPTKDSQGQITATAALLNGHPDMSVLIKGHTDNTGNTSSNTVLSLTRSGYMKNALVKLGIDARRIKVQGVGSLEPIAPNDTEDGRNSNRRIELILTD